MRKIIHENVKSKLVHDPLVARALLRRGCEVIDCKPLKNDRQRTVLVFKDTPEFREHLAELSKEWNDIDINTMEISNPKIARALLKKGMTLVDYKEAKVDEKSKMVFVFKNDEEFTSVFEALVEDTKTQKEEFEQIEICLD